jgi:uncharacterized protein (TIGR02996 family)
MSESAFLAAICAQPDEDTPRLAFADWLDEHDRPVRAQFIRDQIALARMDEADPRYPALLARALRCGVLTDPAHLLKSERGLPDVMFRRGFVAGWQTRPAWFLGSDPAQLELVPFEQLRLNRPENDSRNDGHALAQRREFAKVRTLAFDPGWSVHDLEPLLTNCPHLANLRALNVGDTGEEEEVRSLLPRLVLPNLDSLAVDLGSFYGNEDDDPDELEEPPLDDWGEYLPANLPALRRLHFDGSSDDNGSWVWPGPDCGWLTRSRHWPRLEVANVRMSANPISYGNYVAVAPPGDLFRRLKDGRLTRLMVNGNWVESLLKVADWGSVRELEVHGEFDCDLLARLLTAPQTQRLVRLALAADKHRRPFQLGSLPELLQRGQLLPNLKHLGLGNLPGEFLTASFCRGLLRLDIGSPGLYEPGLAPLARADLPQLRHLTVNGVHSEEEFAPLFTATNMPNLCTVSGLGSESDTLSRLASNPALPHLSLVGTRIGWQDGCWVLGDGEVRPVPSGVIPMDEDWWEPDPLMDWFW